MTSLASYRLPVSSPQEVMDAEFHRVIRQNGQRVYLTPALWRTLERLAGYAPGVLIPVEAVEGWYHQLSDSRHSFRNDLWQIRKALKGSGWRIETWHRIGWVWRTE